AGAAAASCHTLGRYNLFWEVTESKPVPHVYTNGNQKLQPLGGNTRMFRKSALFVLIVVLAAFPLGALHAQDGGYTLGLSLSTLNNPFFVTLRDGAQAAADRLGVELIVLDSQDDPATEAANMEDLIAQGVDAILVNPTDSDAIVPSIEAANAAGIPVFTVDRGASGGEVVAHIASDNVAGGRLAAEYLCNAL